MNQDIYQQVREVSFLNAHARIGEDKVENSAIYQQSCINGPLVINALLALTDSELLEKADLCDAEFDELENQLALRAACLGWTGDPMRQPLETIAAIVRVILS